MEDQPLIPRFVLLLLLLPLTGIILNLIFLVPDVLSGLVSNVVITEIGIKIMGIIINVVLIVVILIQARISEQQTLLISRQAELAEIDKKPFVDIQIEEYPSKKPYCSIHNLSKYPVRILDIHVNGESIQPTLDPEFLLKDKPMRLTTKVIPVDKAVKIDLNNFPKKIEIKVANLLYRDICLVYKYDVSREQYEVESC